MADADILSETFDLLMHTAKDLTAKLSGLVPDGLYLPAPPLYCPQPALDTEAGAVDLALRAELVSRQRVSGVLQRVLLLFRAARCSLPSAQWYIQKLKHSRKIMNKTPCLNMQAEEVSSSQDPVEISSLTQCQSVQ